MNTFENAIFKGNLFCVYSLKNNGEYDEELRLKMKKASQNGELICPECHKPLVLCAGQLVLPYLRHEKGSTCTEARNCGSEQSIKARALLFDLAKRSFPDAEIVTNYKLDEQIADVYINDLGNKIAIDFYMGNEKLEKCEQRFLFYCGKKIKYIMLLDEHEKRAASFSTFEYLIAKLQDRCLILNTQMKTICFQKQYKAEDEKKYIVEKTYNIAELRISKQGIIETDFDNLYLLKKEKIDMLVYRRKQEEQKEKDKQDRIKLEVQKKNHELQQRKKEEQEQEKAIKLDNYWATINKAKGIFCDGKIVREKLVENGKRTYIMYVSALDEYWLIPPFKTGETWMINKADEERSHFLYSMNDYLQKNPSSDNEKLVCKSIDVFQSRSLFEWYTYWKKRQQ